MIAFALKRHVSSSGKQTWQTLQLVLRASTGPMARRCSTPIRPHPSTFPPCHRALLPPRLPMERRLPDRSFRCSSPLFCQGKREDPRSGKPGTGELDLHRTNERIFARAPKPAIYLGFSGLVPFVAVPVLMIATRCYCPEAAYWQVVYGASIVSFLGGARWGFALPEGSPAQPDWRNLGHSVVPSLLAWVAFLLGHDVMPAAVVVIAGLGLTLHYDLFLLPGYPGWFKSMRAILTLVAVVSLVATLVIKGVWPEKKIKEMMWE